MRQDFLITRNVSDLQESGKRWLENVLGQSLENTQQVFIMAFTPDVVPDDAARSRAKKGLEETWERVAEHTRKQGISAEEFDAAADEASGQVRSPES